MKIAIIFDMIYPFSIGGAELRNFEIAKRLSKNHEVHLFGVKLWEGPDIIKKGNITIHGVCKYKRNNDHSHDRRIIEPFKFALALFFPLLKENFDIIDVSAFAYPHCFTAKLVSILKHTPLVFTWHQYWGDYWDKYLGKFKGYFGKKLESTIKLLGTNHIAVSFSTKIDLIKDGIKESHVFVNYCGVDLNEVTKIEATEKKYDIIFVGRLNHQKNIPLLVEAVALLKNELPDIRVNIVGDGPAKENIIALIRKLGLENNFYLKGFIRHPHEIFKELKQSKIFVLPSLLEGFGIVVIEAFACGLPVIAINYKWNASKELINDGQDGLISENNAQVLSEKIKRLVSHNDLVSEMSRKATAKAQKFDWDVITKELENYYLRIIHEN